MRLTSFWVSSITVVLSLLIAACSKDSPTESANNFLTKVSGDSQIGAPGDKLSKPLEVLVTDKSGMAVSGQWVEYSVIEGDASLSTLMQ